MFKKLGLKKFFIKIRFTKLGLKEISGKKFCQNNFPEKIFRKKRFPKFGEKNSTAARENCGIPSKKGSCSAVIYYSNSWIYETFIFNPNNCNEYRSADKLYKRYCASYHTTWHDLLVKTNVWKCNPLCKHNPLCKQKCLGANAIIFISLLDWCRYHKILAIAFCLNKTWLEESLLNIVNI